MKVGFRLVKAPLQRLRTVGIAGRTRADRRKSVTAPDGPGPHDGLRSEVKRS